MAKREVLVLNEDVPQSQVPQVGDTYQLPRDVEVLGDLQVTGEIHAEPDTNLKLRGGDNESVLFIDGKITSDVEDGAGVSAYTLDTINTIGAAGANLLTLKKWGRRSLNR